ncbi:MAG: hypothetical protein J6A96_04135 [Clostridia bacterium]|nr:hypothetical protein [Clostridia bacterium]
MKLITSNNKRKEKYLYGNKLDSLSNKLVSSEIDKTIEPRYAKVTIGKIELSKSPDKTHDMLVLTRFIGSKTVIEIKDLETIRSDSEFECDARIISTFEMLNSKRDVRRIFLDTFLSEIKEKFKLDIRTAYKKIETSATKKDEHSVYIYHMYGLLAASISIINELDFKPPVYIELKKIPKGIKLSLKIKSPKLDEIKNRQKLIDIPGIEMRLEYLGLLCQEDGINGTFEITNNTLNIEYDIVEAPYKEGVLLADTQEEDRFFYELMEIFSYKGADREEEE